MRAFLRAALILCIGLNAGSSRALTMEEVQAWGACSAAGHYHYDLDHPDVPDSENWSYPSEYKACYEMVPLIQKKERDEKATARAAVNHDELEMVRKEARKLGIKP